MEINKRRRFWTAGAACWGLAAITLACAPARAQDLTAGVDAAARAVERGREVQTLAARATNPSGAAIKSGERAAGTAINTAGGLLGRGAGQLFGSGFGRFFGRGAKGLLGVGEHIAVGAARGVSGLSSGVSRNVVDSGANTVVRDAKKFARNARDKAWLQDREQSVARLLGAAGPMASLALSQAARGASLDLNGQSGWAALLASAARDNPELLQSILGQASGSGVSQTNMLALIASAVRGDAGLAQALIDRAKDPNADSHVNELVQAAMADNLPMIRNVLLSGGDITSTIATQALATVLQRMLPPGPARDLAGAVSGGMGATAAELAPAVKEGAQSLAELLNNIGGE